MQTTPGNPISPQRRLKFLIGGGVIAALVVGLVVMAMARPGSTAYYLTTTEMADLEVQDDQEYRVNGTVASGSIEPDGLETTFTITDGSTEMQIVTSDPLPDTFKDESEVVARGAYNGGTFEATEVLAKCPSKFKAKD